MNYVRCNATFISKGKKIDNFLIITKYRRKRDVIKRKILIIIQLNLLEF